MYNYTTPPRFKYTFSLSILKISYELNLGFAEPCRNKYRTKGVTPCRYARTV